MTGREVRWYGMIAIQPDGKPTIGTIVYWNDETLTGRFRHQDGTLQMCYMTYLNQTVEYRLVPLEQEKEQ